MIKNERGMTLIEVIIALGILGILAVAFFGVLSTASMALFVADEHITAESLARSQIEYVKAIDYEYGVTEYTPAPIPDAEDDAGYSVTIDVEPLHPTDEGIQKITVTVWHDSSETSKEILTLVDFKVDQ